MQGGAGSCQGRRRGWVAARLGLATLGVLWVAMAGAAPEPKEADPTEEALRGLKARYDDAKWDLKKAVLADLNGDGVTDAAVPGKRGGDFAIGFALGPLGAQATVMRIVWSDAEKPTGCAVGKPALAAEPVTLPADLWGCRDGNAEDAFCADARAIEAWLGEVRERGVQGLRLTGVACQTIHLYWNPKAGSFDQWREH